MLREAGRLTLRVTITMTILVVTVVTAISLLALTQAATHASLSSFATVLLDPVAELYANDDSVLLRYS